MTADPPAAPPPVALTQERIAELRGLRAAVIEEYADPDRYFKWTCALHDAAEALLSAASSGAEARERADLAERNARIWRGELGIVEAVLAEERVRTAAAEARAARLAWVIADVRTGARREFDSGWPDGKQVQCLVCRGSAPVTMPNYIRHAAPCPMPKLDAALADTGGALARAVERT